MARSVWRLTCTWRPSSTNFSILEQGRLNPNNPTDVTLLRELFGEWRPDPAYFWAPERPGLGMSMSNAYVREHSVDIATAERG